MYVIITLHARCIEALTRVGEFDKVALQRSIAMFEVRIRGRHDSCQVDDETGFSAIH